VADFLNLSRNAYRNYENNIREIPVEILSKLAEFYHTSVDYLIAAPMSPARIRPVKISSRFPTDDFVGFTSCVRRRKSV
jgi:transcriptional regulator with XRE-family HTH domain